MEGRGWGRGKRTSGEGMKEREEKSLLSRKKEEKAVIEKSRREGKTLL